MTKYEAVGRKRLPHEPSKPPKAPFEGFEGDPRSGFSEIDPVSLAERSAIVEYGASVPRDWAEGFARLNLANPLASVSGSHWWILINDGGKFLDRRAVEAIRLGWQAADVFSIHPTAPAYRYDQTGLGLLIDGGEVTEISQWVASIQTPIGSRLSYARQASNRSGVCLLGNRTRGQLMKPREQHYGGAARNEIDPDEPLRLADALRIAFPHGGMTLAGLRREIGRQRLTVEKIAGKHYTTLNNIAEMRR